MNALALGTVQLGLPYGATNRAGLPDEGEVAEILELAHRNHFRILDTAPVYGDAEARLGALGASGRFDIVSKTLPFSRVSSGSPVDAVAATVECSLNALRTTSLHGLLVHDVSDLLGPEGEALHGFLLRARSEGIARRIGVSVYHPEELEVVLDRFEIDLVQAPVNVLDQRFLEPALLARLEKRGIELHARSAFLQGVLLAPVSELAPYFAPVRATLHAFENAAGRTTPGKVAACLRFLLDSPGVARVVVGVAATRELSEIVTARAGPGIARGVAKGLACRDLEMIDPSRWPPRERLVGDASRS